MDLEEIGSYGWETGHEVVVCGSVEQHVNVC